MKSECRKVAFVNEGNGEVVRVACGRRSCSRCRGSYAVKLGSAIEAVHGKKATHFVFTIKSQEGFPNEGHYLASKGWQRDYVRNLKTDKRITAGVLAKIRDKIKKGSERVSRGVRDLRKIIGTYMDIDPESIGYIRAIEFGEKGTRRFHAHCVIMKDFWPVMQALDKAGCKYKYDELEDIYVFKNTPFWLWGAVRVCGLSRAKGAIEYVSEYSTKNSPGRITVDPASRRSRRERQEVISKIFRAKYGNLGEKYDYVGIGASERAKEAKLDAKYERERIRRKKRRK